MIENFYKIFQNQRRKVGLKVYLILLRNHLF